MTERKYKIVHLDDEYSLGVSVCSELRAEGYDAYYIPSKREALPLIKKYLPDLIISDIKSPDMDGFEFLKILKSDPVTARIPFIFLTAFATLENAKTASQLGANDFVSKPFDHLELLNVIQRVLKDNMKSHNEINLRSQSTEPASQ
jgi:DNA-binding response OmpR family regulator